MFDVPYLPKFCNHSTSGFVLPTSPWPALGRIKKWTVLQFGPVLAIFLALGEQSAIGIRIIGHWILGFAHAQETTSIPHSVPFQLSSFVAKGSLSLGLFAPPLWMSVYISGFLLNSIKNRILLQCGLSRWSITACEASHAREDLLNSFTKKTNYWLQWIQCKLTDQCCKMFLLSAPLLVSIASYLQGLTQQENHPLHIADM